jgi:hypothetical protein
VSRRRRQPQQSRSQQLELVPSLYEMSDRKLPQAAEAAGEWDDFSG